MLERHVQALSVPMQQMHEPPVDLPCFVPRPGDSSLRLNQVSQKFGHPANKKRIQAQTRHFLKQFE